MERPEGPTWHELNTFLLEKHRLWAGAADEIARAHFEQGAATGRDAQKTLVVLNGGALLAMPAFKGLLPEVQAEQVVWPIAIFLCGLLAAGISYVYSYFSLRSGAEGWKHEEAARVHRLSFEAPGADRVTLEGLRSASATKAEFNWARARLFSAVAVSTAIASLLFFAVGAFIGVLGIMTT